jgi:tRNA threonylcarbamoyladenosine biosynthesis protein TsaE
MGLTILNTVEATQAFAESWTPDLTGGEIFALYGVLGSGKTQLVKGIARGLGYRGAVTSPTFTLVHEYLGGRSTISIFTAFRLKSRPSKSVSRNTFPATA